MGLSTARPPAPAPFRPGNPAFYVRRSTPLPNLLPPVPWIMRGENALVVLATILLLAALLLAATAAQAAQARHRWEQRNQPSAGAQASSSVSCQDVRRFVSAVGLDAARAQARQMGMTRDQERRAARCLNVTEAP